RARSHANFRRWSSTSRSTRRGSRATRVDDAAIPGKIRAMAVVTAEDVERTIASFTRLDQRGDKKAMNKLAQRLQKEQRFLLQHAAAIRTEHGDAVGEAAVFYATLVWAMFDRGHDGTLPRLTAQNLLDADRVVTDALAAVDA